MTKSFKNSPFEKYEDRKAGRPKTKQGDYKNINISVPIEILEKLDNVKVIYKNNLTLYVNKLIERDLDENYERYKKIIEDLKMFD